MTASTPQPARASVWSVALAGVDGQRIEIRAQLQDADDPAGHAWQLDDTREVRERVRAAVRNSDLPWPARPVTLTTFPVAPPSGLAGCDLAWACAVLAADGTVAADLLEHTVLLGELALDGRLRPVRGVLSALLVARRAGLRQAIVPAAALPEAALVPDIHVLGADSLSDVVAWLRGEDASLTPPSQAITVPEPGGADLADVIGQPEAALGLEVAAAGGHHLLLIGPPGTGKGMLAQRLPGLLPPLSHEQALEVTAIHSIAGLLTPESPLVTTPPFVAPHHSASFPALLGGGNGLARPGAISMAHHGVLFLDEICELGPSRLDAVRTALDEGEIRLARRDGIARYPARFQLVAATCPCPCDTPEPECQCSPQARRRYLARLSAALLDRIDLRVRLRPVVPFGAAGIPVPGSTAVVWERVRQARQRAAHRWSGHGAQTNAEVPAIVLRREFSLPSSVTVLLERALAVGAVTRRGADRCIRVAWTLADLADLERPGPDQIAAALEFRDRRPADPEEQ